MGKMTINQSHNKKGALQLQLNLIGGGAEAEVNKGARGIIHLD